MNVYHQVYSFRVVAVDGEYQTPSRVQVGVVNHLFCVTVHFQPCKRLMSAKTCAPDTRCPSLLHLSPPQSVNTYLNIAAGHQPQQSTLASSGWFIGMLLAIVFLLGVCLVVCLVKRNRGGKYAVQVMSCF